MTSRRYRLSRAAEAELLEVWSYVFEHSQIEQRAEKVVRDIASKFTTLADFPHIGRSREELVGLQGRKIA